MNFSFLVIKYWLDKCGWDFHEHLINKVNDFINGSLSRDGLLSLVKQLRASVNKLFRKVNHFFLLINSKTHFLF